MTCPNVVESGVYLLGALSPGERQAYERHLATCAECRAEVSDLAALPGLLGRIDEATLTQENAPVAPATVLPTVLTKVRRRRRSRRTLAFAGALAAACLALVAGLVMPPRPTNPPGAVPPHPSTSASPSTSAPATVDMKPTGADNGLSASIMVTGDSSGTRVDGTCTYLDSNPYAEAGNYSLWIITKTGKIDKIESWHALPGTKVTLVAQTWWPKDQLKRIEMRDSTGTVVLYYDL